MEQQHEKNYYTIYSEFIDDTTHLCRYQDCF